MKIIDLINMRAEGKEMPKKIRIDHWCYNFEWIEHDENYYDKDNDIDLMSCLSMNQEELNYEVKVIEEDKEIEKLENEIEFYSYSKYEELKNDVDKTLYILKAINLTENKISNLNNKLNEIIDKVNSLEKKQ